MDYETLENDLEYSVNVAEKFEDLQFEDYDEINEKIKNGKYIRA